MKTNMRANRVAVTVIEGGFEAKFYRTHAYVGSIISNGTWVADTEANATTNRENFRTWVCEHAEEYGIVWSPAKAEQAWERKHNTYMTDDEVNEDACTLVAPTLERLADKCRFDMSIVDIEMVGLTPKASTLGYVTDGRYNKSGAWCVADIEMSIQTLIGGREVEIPFQMEIKSGQICKPKMTIAEFNEHVAQELDLQGIVINDSNSEVA